MYGKTRQITGISQKKTTTKPGITSTLKDKEKAFHATLFSFFFSCRAGFHQVNLSSFLGAFWTFLGYQPQRGWQPNKTKKKQTSFDIKIQKAPNHSPVRCPNVLKTNPSDIMIHRHLPARTSSEIVAIVVYCQFVQSRKVVIGYISRLPQEEK